eukprot:1160387-Pelagomonas_calceolata.AAC.1
MIKKAQGKISLRLGAFTGARAFGEALASSLVRHLPLIATRLPLLCNDYAHLAMRVTIQSD